MACCFCPYKQKSGKFQGPVDWAVGREKRAAILQSNRKCDYAPESTMWSIVSRFISVWFTRALFEISGNPCSAFCRNDYAAINIKTNI